MKTKKRELFIVLCCKQFCIMILSSCWLFGFPMNVLLIWIGLIIDIHLIFLVQNSQTPLKGNLSINIIYQWGVRCFVNAYFGPTVLRMIMKTPTTSCDLEKKWSRCLQEIWGYAVVQQTFHFARSCSSQLLHWQGPILHANFRHRIMSCRADFLYRPNSRCLYAKGYFVLW